MNNTLSYLCGGTFLSQILRARNQLKTSTEHTKCQKENLSEHETFRRLISIYQLKDFYGGTSLKTYTSQYKSCQKSLTAYTQFNDNDLCVAFDSSVKGHNLVALKMMSDFVGEFINVKDKGVQLVRCLLSMIKNDDSIPKSDLFFIKIGEAVKKENLITMDSFEIEPLLLGIWHYIIMNRADKNENGVSTYRLWYSSKDNYCGTVGNDILQNINVSSIHIFPSATETKNERPIIPLKTSNATEKMYSQSDELLLKEFTSDYDELVMKCIGDNFADYVINESICRNITSLYETKWCTKANEFEGLSLKPNVWALLNCLNEFCKKFDFDTPCGHGSNLHQIKTKLRNLYVKLHPHNYANVFLYDVLYDDWNLGEEY